MFRGFLKQSTAATRSWGPVALASDGDTEYTGAYLDTDVTLQKNSGAFVAKSDVTDLTHRSGGTYDIVFNATDTNTLGMLLVQGHLATTLIVSDWWWVLPPVVYDSLLAAAATDYLQVDTVQVGGATASTVADMADAVLDDDATARTTANSIGKAINVLTALAARVNNAELNALLGVADSAAKTLINSIVSDGTAINTTAGVVDSVTTVGTTTTNTDMRGTDSAALASVCTEARLAELDAGNLPLDITTVNVDVASVYSRIGVAGAGLTNIGGIGTGAITAASFAANAIDAAALATDATNEIRNAILADATPFNGANIDAAISSRATPTQVNAEVLDVLATDTFAEPASVPGATATIVNMIHWGYTLSRNKKTQTATTSTLRNDADAANIGTKAVSTDGTTYTSGEWA